jgi:hypothetical protein
MINIDYGDHQDYNNRGFLCCPASKHRRQHAFLRSCRSLSWKSLYFLQELTAGASQRKVVVGRVLYQQEAQDVLAKCVR